MAVVSSLPPEVVAAYNAPFPDDSYKAGARIFPRLVPTDAEDPAAAANVSAREALCGWDKPFLTLYSDSDPITGGAEVWFQHNVPGAAKQPHSTIVDAGHFLQEDQGPRLAELLAGFVTAP
jgi:haloalkane dehalogenase